ncbi:MAG TPA: cell division protein FtsZ [Bryobacterales bacterium]|nr:cell division protein FtsZ [Bryobacterales bacterium]
MTNEGVKFTFDDQGSTNTRIKVFGVGGAGCNAVNRMIEAGVEGVTFTAINTDDQALRASNAEFKLQLGARLTLGRGAGSDPEVGRAAALEDTEKLIELLGDADMVFVTAGLGGGTGTGAAPIVASLANELGALTVAVVTKPFAFEGRQRMAIAEKGLAELAEAVDTVITIPNERLIEVVERGTSFFESFRIADDILRQAVQGISDIITIPGIINRDFADVRTIMHGMGYAVMGTAVAEGPNAAIDAARKAVSSPLLEDAGIDGARGLLISITGSSKIGLHDVHEASSVIQKTADPEANIIFGAVLDESMGDKIKITVIATGFRSESMGVSRKMSADAAISNAEIRQNLQQAAASRDRSRGFPAPREAVVEAESGEEENAAALRPRYEPLEEPEEAEMDSADLEKPAYLRRRMGID